MESLFGTLKSELVYHCVYHTRGEAKANLFFYIESFARLWRTYLLPLCSF